MRERGKTLRFKSFPRFRVGLVRWLTEAGGKTGGAMKNGFEIARFDCFFEVSDHFCITIEALYDIGLIGG